MQRSPTPRDGLVYALGSGFFSALIAGGAGRVYGINATTLVVMIVLAALGGGFYGYRARMKQE